MSDGRYQKVSAELGRPLTMSERRVVEVEGYEDSAYTDDKGVTTSGVGQTGEWMGKSFDETFAAHKQRARDAVPSLDKLPEYLQAELTQLAYRGDVKRSHNWVKLLNAGRVAEAAEELLDHAEYKERKRTGKPDGVVKRLEAAQAALFQYSQDARSQRKAAR